MIIRDVSTNSSVVMKGKLPKADLYVVDMTYCSGIDGGKAGIILSESLEYYNKVLSLVKAIGNGVQPMDSFINMRGLKTLGLRTR